MMTWWTIRNWFSIAFRNWELILVLLLGLWILLLNNQKQNLITDIELIETKLEKSEFYSQQLIGTIDVQNAQIEQMIAASMTLKRNVEEANIEVEEIQNEALTLIDQLRKESTGNTFEETNQWLYEKRKEILEKWKN